LTPATLAPTARRELLAVIRRIAKDHPNTARALREAVARAAERIGTHPHIGVLRHDLTTGRYRFLPLTGFPYLIVYDPARDPPVIARIIHSARDLPRALRDLAEC
jgi:toxin ParE1/3/4